MSASLPSILSHCATKRSSMLRSCRSQASRSAHMRTATTSRVHSRAWHKTDTGCVQGDERLDSYECGSVEETATAEAKSLYINEQPHTRPVNVPDYYTMTRGGETALYQFLFCAYRTRRAFLKS